MKTRGKIFLKRVVRPNNLSILNFKSVAPAAFYRTLIQPSCDPAHDDRPVCEVTQACYHVRGSGFHWVWDLIWDQWNLQGEPFIMFLLFRIRTSGNDVSNTPSVVENCVSYLSWSSIHPSIHFHLLDQVHGVLLNSTQYLQSVEPSENSHRHANRIKTCNCLQVLLQLLWN